jgi:hypothetical protein
MKKKKAIPAILASFLVFSVLAVFQLYGWIPLKYWAIAGPRPFVDLEAVLGSTDCYRRIGLQVYEYPFGHPCSYNYGSFLLRFISSLGVGKSDTVLLGFTFIILFALFVGIFVYYSRISGFKPLLFLGLVIFSPPLLLLFERGNLDIFIYLLISISALLNARNWLRASLMVIFSAALFKFYPIILFFYAATIQKVRKIFPYLVIAAFGLLQILNDYRKGPGFINTQWTSFGAPVAGEYFKFLGINIPYLWSLCLGIFLLAITVIFVFRLTSATTLWVDIDILKLFPNRYTREIYTFNLVTHITCYILGTSFDYRLVFLASSCVLLTFNVFLPVLIRRIISVSILLILWTSTNVIVLQPLGDVTIGLLTALFIIQVFQHWYSNQSEILRAHLERFVQFLSRSKR